MEELQLELGLYQLTSLLTFLRTICVLLARAGFLIIQIGSVPANNVSSVILQNLVDLSISTLIFFLLGFPIAFGDSLFGLIGHNKWIWQEEDFEWSEEMILGWSCVIIASGIFTSMTVDRMHPLGYTLVYLVSAGFVQPLIIHWSWHQDAWLREKIFSNYDLSFHDQGGGLLIHGYGGIWAYMALTFLGRRVFRLTSLDQTSLPPGSPALSLLGYILLTTGILVIPLPTFNGIRSSHFLDGFTPIAVNGLLAICTGIAIQSICFGLDFKTPLNHWSVLRCLKGGLSSLVLLLPGIEAYHPTMAILLSIGGTLIFHFVTRSQNKLASEDYCNILEVHLLPGVVGVLIEPLLAVRWKHYQDSQEQSHILPRLGWQFLGLLALLLFTAMLAAITMLFILTAGLLRNDSEFRGHQLANELTKQKKTKSFQRIFQIQPNSLILEPGYGEIKDLIWKENSKKSKQKDVSWRTNEIISQHHLETTSFHWNQGKSENMKNKNKFTFSARSLPDISNSTMDVFFNGNSWPTHSKKESNKRIEWIWPNKNF